MEWNNEKRDELLGDIASFSRNYANDQLLGLVPAGSLDAARKVVRQLTVLMPQGAHNAAGFTLNPCPWLQVSTFTGPAGVFNGNTRVVAFLIDNTFHLGLRCAAGAAELADPDFIFEQLPQIDQQDQEVQNILTRLRDYQWTYRPDPTGQPGHLTVPILVPEGDVFPFDHPLSETSAFGALLNWLNYKYFAREEIYAWYQNYLTQRGLPANGVITPMAINALELRKFTDRGGVAANLTACLQNWDRNLKFNLINFVRAVHNAGLDWYATGNYVVAGFKDNSPVNGQVLAHLRFNQRSVRVVWVNGINASGGFLTAEMVEEFKKNVQPNLGLWRPNFRARQPRGYCPADYLPLDGSLSDELTNTLNTDNVSETIAMSKNIILYGPPGTGKTFSTLLVSVAGLNLDAGAQARMELLRNGTVDVASGYTELRTEFERRSSAKEIEFTTFHQSYSYEDFIEGIRVRTVDGQPHYEIRNGLFKKMARKALFYKVASQLDDLGVQVGSEAFVMAANAYAETLDENLKSLEGDTAEICNKVIAYVGGNGYRATEPASHRFVLIIDEINRGNIAKIFGELITLIEESKRYGADDCFAATLPYSGERFVVPDNLYIVGTMNTADRSLATLDVALRRRFEFIEMMPQPSLLGALAIPGVNLQQWLTELNKNIQLTRGREFTIGHAFFMDLLKKTPPSLEDLASIMRGKILPLLDEYFFEDWEGIRRVLGDSADHADDCFVIREEMPGQGRGRAQYIYRWNPKALKNAASYTKLHPKQ